MWFIGLVIGAALGAGLHGFYGAMWGAIIGWLIALLLGRSSGASADAASKEKFSGLDKRVTHAQKSLEDIHWRLSRLEEKAGLPASPLATATAPDTKGVVARATENANVADVAPVPSMAAVPSANIPALPIAAAKLEAAHASVPTAQLPQPASIAPALSEVPIKKVSTTTSATEPTESTEPSRQIEITPGIVERLLEGNIVAKLGVVILFFGVGFLLKFAYDRGVFPPQLRLLGVAAASAVMFFLGLRLLQKKRTYALILFGGAMGLLYLDVFFALKTFALISAPVGFVLFAVLGIATVLLAVRLDARAFAALGLLGAFMAPILASTGGGNHVLLFSYYLLLNLVILGASWFKAWRELNFIGFLFTFAIALIWGYTSYQPEHFSTIEPFLIAFFFLYLAIPILFAHRQPPQLKGLVDGTLIFGMPLSAAMLQAALTRGLGDMILAWSALSVALIYASLAWALWKREKMRLLAEAHLALALVFGTVAPYFALRGYPTFAFWTIEGAAIFWMGCRQKSVLARAFALCLQFGAAGYFWSVTNDLSYADPWWNDRVIGCGLIAAASLLTAWFMHRFEESISKIEASLQGFVIAWGCVWLFAGFTAGAWRQWEPGDARISALLFFAVAAFTIFEWFGAWTNWRLLRLTSRAHVLLIGALTLAWSAMVGGAHPLIGGGIVAWPLTFAAYFYVLHRQRRDGVERSEGWRYKGAWFLMLVLATWEVMWRHDQQQFVWVFAIGAAGLVAAALRFRLREYSADVEVSSLVRLSNLPLLWALVWWFAGVHGMIETRTLSVHHLALHLTLAAISVLIFEITGRLLAWPALRRTQVLLTLCMLLATVYLADHEVNPFMGAQFFAWLLAFIIGDVVLARQEHDNKAWLPQWQHVALFNLALLLVAWEWCWRADDAALSSAWQYAGVGFTIALGMAVATFGISKNRWPFGPHAATFRSWSAIPLLLMSLLWTLFANVDSSGSIAPLPYVPLLNPLDLAQLALFAAALWSVRDVAGKEEADKYPAQVVWVFAATGFFWLNAALLRTVHHWADVPFALSALLHSVIAEAALSLLWTSTALVMMLAAGKKLPPSRALWMAGAALLGVVLVKLFLNDLGNTGTVARIVSFIGVGVLLLVIGYVAPVPPKAQAARNDGM